MYLACTKINYNDKTYQIDNSLIIEYLLKKNMDISESITENPYFIFKLFNLFLPLKDNKIVNLNCCKGKVIVETNDEKLEITENCLKGLTLVKDVFSNDEGNFLVKSRRIYELFPNVNGFIFIQHEQEILNNINLLFGEYRNTLSISYIDSSGIKTMQDDVVVPTTTENLLMCLNLTIEPLLFKEYMDLLYNYSSLEKSTYNRRKRDSNNSFLLHDTLIRNKKDRHRKRYFNDNNVLNAMDLDSYFVTNGSLKVDSITTDIIGKKILDALNCNITYYIKDKSRFKNEQLEILKKIIENNKKLMYT